MEYQLYYDGITEKNKRIHNMDSILMCVREIHGDKVGFFVLCDGVGSSMHGGEVARFLTQALGDWFFRQTLPKHLGVSLNHEIFALNQQILQRYGDESASSTLSALVITSRTSYFSHAGDSRIYQAGKNLADPWQALSHDHKNQNGELLDYLGKKSHLAIDSWESPLKSTQFLLCSDGFYQRLDWEKASLALGSVTTQTARPTLERLSESVKLRGECDNISAILVSVEK